MAKAEVGTSARRQVRLISTGLRGSDTAVAGPLQSPMLDALILFQRGNTKGTAGIFDVMQRT